MLREKVFSLADLSLLLLIVLLSSASSATKSVFPTLLAAAIRSWTDSKLNPDSNSVWREDALIHSTSLVSLANFAIFLRSLLLEEDFVSAAPRESDLCFGSWGQFNFWGLKTHLRFNFDSATL